jgi:DNA modification methylase
MSRTFLDGKVTLLGGDSREVLKTLPEASVDSVVTDPPYGISFMSAKWDGSDSAPFVPDFWREVMRVLKPGGHLVAFSSSRTYHRLAVAIEDAGFEIRDSLWYLHSSGPLLWTFGGGFPKSRNVSRDLNGVRCMCGVREGAAEAASCASPEVLQSDVYGAVQATGTPPKDVQCLRLGVDAADTSPSGQECDLFGGVRGRVDFVNEDGVCSEATHRLRGVRGRGEGSATVKEEEAERGILQPVVPRKGRVGANSGQARPQRSLSVDGGEPCLLPQEDDWRIEPGVEGRGDIQEEQGQLRGRALRSVPAGSEVNGHGERLRDGASPSDGAMGRASPDANGVRASHRSQPAEQCAGEPGAVAVQPDAQARGAWPSCGRCGKPVIPDGLGTALKPAVEPCVLARKALIGTVAANVLAHGTGALNIDATRIEGSKPDTTRGAGGANGMYSPIGGQGRVIDDGRGRWPANLIHDGSEEVVSLFPEGRSAGDYPSESWGTGQGVAYCGAKPQGALYADSGSAARFFASFPVEKECRCGLCRLLYVPDSHTTDECNANAAASTLPTPSTQADGSAPSGAAASSLRASAGTKSRQKQRALSVANGSSPCPPQRRSTAQSSAPTPPTLSLVQNVKSAANLCGSCATAIAHALVEARQRRSAASILFPGSIDERSSQILRQSLALYVAGREDTDIITTTPSLKILLGSVFHAIAESTPESEAEQWASSEKSRRFWYDSKADADDRLGSRHPTIKPVSLMQWLVRLVTKKGGTVLDPFAGTGTTGEAAWREGCRAILIEREEEYQQDIARRMELAQQPTKRAAVAKTKNAIAGHDDLPLFGRWPEAAE